jgi:Putative transposase, YhgA-like/Domain of unknown function (DUF4351)
MRQQELIYRNFFSDLHTIRNLLREIPAERWAERLDFDSGELVITAFYEGFKSDRDVLWMFRRKDGGDPVYLYFFLELQSRPAPSTPFRVMACVADLYKALLDSQPPDARKKLPLVIPIVMNTSGKRWDVATDLGSLLGDKDSSTEIYRPQFRYCLLEGADVDRLFGRIQERRTDVDPLEEVESLLARNIGRWEGEIRQEEGVRLVLRQLHLKFGPLEPEIEERMRSADAERLLEWGERVLTAGSIEDVFRD